MWYDDSEHCDETMKIIFFKWYDGYKKLMVKKPQHKKSSCYYLASIKIMGLVYLRGREKRHRKIVGINMDLFVSCDQIQKKFLSKKN